MNSTIPRSQSAAIVVLRWVVFLPAAIVGSLIASVLAHGITWFFWSIDPSRAEIVLREIFEGASFGAAFVFVGLITAPKYATWLAVLLGTLGTLLSIGLTLDALGNHNWAGGLTAAAGAVASVITSVAAVKEGGFR